MKRFLALISVTLLILLTGSAPAFELDIRGNTSIYHYESRDDFEIAAGVHTREAWNAMIIDQFRTCDGDPGCLKQPLAGGGCVATTAPTPADLTGPGRISVVIAMNVMDVLVVAGEEPNVWPNYHLFDLRVRYQTEEGKRSKTRGIYSRDLNHFISRAAPSDSDATEMISTTVGPVDFGLDVEVDADSGARAIVVELCNSTTQAMSVKLPVKVTTSLDTH